MDRRFVGCEPLEPRQLLSSATRISGGLMPGLGVPPLVRAGDRVAVQFEDGIFAGDKSDGTLETLGPTINQSIGDIEHLTAHQGSLFFLATDRTSGVSGTKSLYSFDMTSRALRQVQPASVISQSIESIGSTGQTLYLTTETDYYADDGWHLYAFNPRAGAFQEIRGPGDSPVIDWTTNLFSFNGRLSFFDHSGSLKRVDAASDGSPVLAAVGSIPVTSPELIAESGGWLFLKESDAGQERWWRTDGTAEITVLVSDSARFISGPTAFKHTSWFTSNDGLYRVDAGTGAAILAMQLDAPATVSSVGDRLILTSPRAVYASDGTRRGTHAITSFSNVHISSMVASEDGFALAIGADASHGTEIWTTDGTAGGTRVLDVYPGATDSDPAILSVAADVSYFAATTPFGRQLFRSDPTATNHAPLAAAEGPFEVFEGSRLHVDASACTDLDNDNLIYQWDLNGDGNFTDLVSDEPQTSISWKNLRKFGMKDGPASVTVTLRVSDALTTSAATSVSVNIKDAPATVNISIPSQVLVNTDWKSAISFSDPGLDTRTKFRIEWGDGAAQDYLPSTTSVVHRYTAAGGFTLKVITTDEDGSRTCLQTAVNVVSALHGGVRITSQLSARDGPPAMIAELNDTLYFAAGDSAQGYSLRRSDGTEYGSSVVSGNKKILHLIRAGDLLYFVTGDTGLGDPARLWRSDGTAAGTIPLASNLDVPAFTLFPFKRKLYFFAGASEADTFYLWTTDGTPAGTRRVASSFAGASLKSEAHVFNGVIYFLAPPSDGTIGRSLYKSDGKTVMEVTRLFSGAGEAKLSVAGAKLYIEREDFAPADASQAAIWQSDGTSAGTHAVHAIGPSRVVYVSSFGGDDTLFLVAASVGSGNTTGQELWAIEDDGNAHLIADIRAGRKSSNIGFLTNFHGYMYFTASDGVHGFELWRSDGTPAGTGLVIDLAAGTASSDIHESFVTDDFLYFTEGLGENDGDTSVLYRTDGTAENTLRLTPASSIVRIASFVPWGSRTLFAVRPSAESQWQWWTTNGMRSGTYQSKLSLPDPQYGVAAHMIGSNVYLAVSQADDLTFPQRDDLWRLYG
jgi:ELWxxDGT repeat protein